MTAVENEKSTVTVTLNGVEIEANPGELLIDAAERHGTYIPRFCYHSRMKPVGMCRMCLVEVDSGRESVTWNQLTTERPKVLEWDEMERYRDEVGIDIH